MTSAGANPSRRALLDTAVVMIEEWGLDGFTVDELLVESGTSSSSLYHHFGSRKGLLIAAQEERYRRLARGEDLRNLDGGLAATTTEEFLAYVARQIERIVTDPANRAVRRSRLEAAARSMASPELATRTAAVQEMMFDVIAAMFDVAQARGLIDLGLDTRAYAAWFHGMTLGRTVTEAGSVGTDAWLAVAIPAALAPLRPPAQP
ncbi:MAG: TetR/AcrR family transcriptional regulator [Actinomycetota bacterium]|nr:TetR/AcrR family transcriptional regulator [Actinomycetota bacterium]